MQRSYRLVARLVRMLVDLKAGARTGIRSAGAHAQGAASGTATVGRGLKGATSQGGAMKDFASGGRNWWSHMPKTPQLPGALADAAQSSSDQQSECSDISSSWAGGLSDCEDMSYLDNELTDVDLSALRTAGPDTPADVLLGILTSMLDGREPDLRDVALARAALLRHLNLYEPFNSSGHIRSADLDADVVSALMHQLGAAATTPTTTTTNTSALSTAGGGDSDPSRSHDARQDADAAAATAAAAAADPSAITPITPSSSTNEEEGSSNPDCLRDALGALLALAAAAPPQLLRQGPAEADGVSSGSGSGSESDVSISGAVAAVPQPMLDEVERMLAMADAWQYDTFRLAEVSQGHALSCLGFYLLHREGLISQFRIRPTKLARLLRTLESGYPSNPYHNSTHAADVLQTLHVLLRGSGLSAATSGGHYLDRLGLMAAYFAAMIHDHGHPGLTSDFLVGTSHPLALRYNDRSPLENHHGASFFELMGQQGLEALEGLAGAERSAFRKLVLDLVLATDMKQHFALLAHFNTAHRLAPYNKEAGPWALLNTAAHSGGAGGGSSSRHQQSNRCTPEPSGGDDAAAAAVAGRHERLQAAAGGVAVAVTPGEEPRPLDETERLLSLQIALKAADLGHLGEELGVHKRWVRCLEEEFFLQGDREAALGLPISPLFDRAKQGASKSQVGFYDFIALPLAHSLASAFPGALPLLAAFTDNYDHWRGVEKKAAAAAAAAAAAVHQQQAAAQQQQQAAAQQ
ncbi:hypothetical protein PLESTB_000940300 [Pleodorina starrii]|uniref:PDEase domain-containing protein n=1 Tax=Pleodorina starrii TaxID=330485 RepID=A0A9W6BMZ2_9CHLO|nr:hypothetical protein PLESTM_000704900 [Pleodorina starrii]GLC55069.1 hypothetical protein PLESTB_000940300 [Pleodorina starrii]GLC71176.1 hypothetical protein PLESTF_001082600 [Pleodorina starrii]